MADEFENYYNKIEVLVNVFTVDKGIKMMNHIKVIGCYLMDFCIVMKLLIIVQMI